MRRKIFLIFIGVILQASLTTTFAVTEIPQKCDITVVVDWSKNSTLRYGQIVPQGDELTPDDINQPRALALDSTNNIYVGDSVNYRIIKFSKDGKLLNTYSLQKPLRNTKPRFGHIIKDIAVDKFDNIYVLNLYEYRIEIYTPNGQLIKVINYYENKLGDKDTEKLGIGYRPSHVAVDHEGNIYIYSDLRPKNPTGGIYSSDGKLVKRGVFIDEPNKNIRKFYSKMVGINGYFVDIVQSMEARQPYYFVVLRDKEGRELRRCGPVNIELPSKQLVDKHGDVYFYEFNTLNIVKIKMH